MMLGIKVKTRITSSLDTSALSRRFLVAGSMVLNFINYDEITNCEKKQTTSFALFAVNVIGSANNGTWMYVHVAVYLQ